MKRWHLWIALTLLGLNFTAARPAAAQNDVIERVGNLNHDIGKAVTIVGRTGYIVSESAGMHVFTLRDDYNDEVFVRSVGTDHPFMGVTYKVTGTPMRMNGTLYLDSADSMMAPVYPVTGPIPPPAPPSWRSQVQLYALSLIDFLLVLAVLAWALHRWTRRPAPEWGVLSVTSGPDRGMNVPLRRKTIAVGRGVSPARDIRLSSGDQTISNRHIVLYYKHGNLYVSDMSSNGTRIGGEKLMPGSKVLVNSGDLIHLGTRGTVLIVRLHAAPPAPGLFSFLRESAPLSDKTIILPDQTSEEPAWKNATADPVLTDATPFHADHDADSHAHANGYAAPGEEDAPLPVQDYSASPIPADEPAQAAALTNDAVAHHQGWVDADDDEDDIPHTLAPPLVFTFAGHDPKPSRLYGVDTPEHGDPDDGEATDTAA